MSRKHIPQDNAMHQKCGSHAERHNISKRIEFAPERAFFTAHARKSPIEQIKNTGQQNENQGVANGSIVWMRLIEIRFNDTRQREESAEEISRRHQIRQEIN